MSKLDSMKDQKFVFGSVLVIANRMDTLLERELKEYAITTKQWLLIVVLDNSFDNPPTIKEVAKEMGSSHQNVKQVALKLEQKGLLILEKDKRDTRATRLKLTENSYEFWKMIKEEGSVFTQTLFKDIDKDDLQIARKVIQTMLLHINEMDNKIESVEKHE